MSPAPTAISPARAATAPVQLRWLVRLRWAAVAAQVASLLGVKYLLRAPFPPVPMAATVTALALANLGLARHLARGRALSDRAVAGHLALDVAALTALLIWSGGAMNPFTTLYLLHVALAAVLVPRRYSLAVTVFAAVAFGGLLLARPEAIHVWHSGAMFLLHVRGMWLAFALTAACLWYFVDRVSTALHAREAELSAAREAALRTERVAALATLAAGTAHELGTPLGTVAILAAELSERLADHPGARAEADKIRAEVRRCSTILAKMRSHEHAAPEPRTAVAVGPWVRDAVAAWCARNDQLGVPVRVAPDVAAATVHVRPAALGQALGNVLDNARLATRDVAAPIAVDVARVGDVLGITVEDRGTGITADDLARLGEPFFTTRGPGQGMGLGLFLVQATLAQHGGGVSFDRADGATRVTLTLPFESA